MYNYQNKKGIESTKLQTDVEHEVTDLIENGQYMKALKLGSQMENYYEEMMQGPRHISKYNIGDQVFVFFGIHPEYILTSAEIIEINGNLITVESEEFGTHTVNEVAVSDLPSALEKMLMWLLTDSYVRHVTEIENQFAKTNHKKGGLSHA